MPRGALLQCTPGYSLFTFQVPVEKFWAVRHPSVGITSFLSDYRFNRVAHVLFPGYILHVLQISPERTRFDEY